MNDKLIKWLTTLLFCCCLIHLNAQKINNEIGGSVSINTSSAYDPIIVKGDLGLVNAFWSSPAIWIEDSMFLFSTTDPKPKKPYFERFVSKMDLHHIVIPDSTFMFGFGYDVSTGIDSRDGKIPSMVSFKISDMPAAGDTAQFEFCFISTTDGKTKSYSPEIFFSSALNLDKKGNVADLSSFKSFGRFEFETLPNGLSKGTLKVYVTPEFQKYSWIHLKNDYYDESNGCFDIGFIAPLNIWKVNKAILNGKYLATFHFQNNDLALDAHEYSRLKSVAALAKFYDCQFTLKISDRSFMNTEVTTFYKNARLEAVRNSLIELGVEDHRIIYEESSSSLPANNFEISVNRK